MFNINSRIPQISGQSTALLLKLTFTLVGSLYVMSTSTQVSSALTLLKYISLLIKILSCACHVPVLL
jgi:hypothetical protein